MTTPISCFALDQRGAVSVIRARERTLRGAEAATLLDLVSGEGCVSHRVVLDLSNVSRVESAALGVLCELDERCTLRVIGMRPLVVSAVEILGMRALLTLPVSLHAALASFPAGPARDLAPPVEAA